MADAGEFSPWLGRARRAHALKVIGAEVPCGTCEACCRSSMFIHIGPDEKATLARIPKRLLFPAPGRPRGHVLMGYDAQGRCPMLAADGCSIYAHRPQTCRDYDCRVFAATGVEVDDRAQALIAERVRAWTFRYAGARDRAEHAAVRAAAAFLRAHQDAIFPDPARVTPAQIALLALRVYDVIRDLEASGGARPPDAEIVRAVLAAMAAPDGADRERRDV